MKKSSKAKMAKKEAAKSKLKDAKHPILDSATSKKGERMKGRGY